MKTSIGTSFTLDCAQPANTSVLWYQDEKLLLTTTPQLTIQDATLGHKGIYKCCLKECTAGNFATAVVDIGGMRLLGFVVVVCCCCCFHYYGAFRVPAISSSDANL